MSELQEFWSQRYNEDRTGWDIGFPSTPLKAYIDQLEDTSLRILIPGAGNAYEAEYLWQRGFHNIYVMDIAENPLRAFAQRVPAFPQDQLLQEDFFSHEGNYDLIIEQTFFCSFIPTLENRKAYAEKMSDLLCTNGKLVGLLFNHPLTGDMEKRPFGGTKEEYLSYMQPLFQSVNIDDCYNSIPPRKGKEYFLYALK